MQMANQGAIQMIPVNGMVNNPQMLQDGTFQGPLLPCQYEGC